jgi:hypothetical protein
MKVIQKRLWRQASLSIGAPKRNLEGSHLPGTLRDERGSKSIVSLSEGNLEEGALLLGTLEDV